MDIKKWVIGGITGGVLFFLLGWVIYGMLLKSFMEGHPGAAGSVFREPDFLYLAIGNLAMGFAIAYILLKGNVSSMAGGFVTAGIVGLLIGIGFDSMMYATSTVISKTMMAADVAASTVMTAIVGAVVAMVMGMGKKTA
jgi:hypothetical protein